MTWIYDIPTWLFMSASVIGSCVLSCGLLALVRRRITRNEEITHNDVAGPILTTIGTVLAVMMSFMVVGVWQEYDGAAQTTQREASALSDLYHLSTAFPQPMRDRMHHAIESYITVVLNREWPAMKRGGESLQADRLTYRIGQMLDDWKWTTPGQQSLKEQGMAYVSRFWDARRSRMYENREGIPLALWAAMLFTGAITVAFSFYFRVDRPRAQYLMVIALTAVIAVIFTLIAELDYPFRGDVAVQPSAFVHVVDQIHGTLPSSF